MKEDSILNLQIVPKIVTFYLFYTNMIISSALFINLLLNK